MTKIQKEKVIREAIEGDNMTQKAAMAWCETVELHNLITAKAEDYKELRCFWYMGWHAAQSVKPKA